MERKDLLGEMVLNAIRTASRNLLLVAPYIKSDALERTIDSIPSESISLTCVTRWLPGDIAAGVCDLDIFDKISKYPDGRLLIHPHLHAKYYRVDHRCLIGSANLTSRGMGWTTPANMELLVELPADFEGLEEWEQRLLASAIPASRELQEKIKLESEQIIANNVRVDFPDGEGIGDDGQFASQWFPRCPVPDRLWEVYSGQAQDKMVTGALAAAQMDISALAVPPGLPKKLFDAYVAGILKYMPMVMEIDNLAARALPDSDAYRFIVDRLGDKAPYPEEEMWRVFKAWLTYFFPEEYRLEVKQEVLVKGRYISDRN